MKNLIAVAFLIWCSCIHASCPELYPNGKTIVVQNTKELCNIFYVVLYDESKNRPIVSFERLRKSVPVGSAPRSANFRMDKRLIVSPVSSQYINTTYDRGHLTPADDASSVSEENETFLMSNVTPQAPKLNRGVWKSLEMQVRTKWVTSPTDIWVATIPAYTKMPRFIAGTIPIPSGYWKIVIGNGPATYTYADNKDDAKLKSVIYFNWKRAIFANP